MIDVIDVSGILPEHPEKEFRERDPSESIKLIVLHHAAGEGSPWDIARWHVESDYPGIGYHSVIMRNGSRWKTALDSQITWHVRGHNTESIGICVGMDLMKESPPLEVYLALIREVHRYRSAYRVSLENVLGHEELVSTACPGLLDVEKIREMLRILEG